MLDVVLHHHEMLDGSGFPDALCGDRISDIVRITSLVDIYATLVKTPRVGKPRSRLAAFNLMESMGDKLDQRLLQTFRPVALGI
jgi:HD-GYP domain-containing protein (c-di-GMP phosphodiesterase class II)